jgi:non-specific serine/threonine protein kinase
LTRAVSFTLPYSVPCIEVSRTNRDAGAWIAHGEEPIPNISLEAREKRLTGEEKELFVASVRSMLKWMPEERYTAKQLLEHPFLL